MKIVGDWAPGTKHIAINLRNGLFLANLEGPIKKSNQNFHSVNKAGPHLFNCELPVHSSKFIFTLANNHIMDFGHTGLEFTLNELKKNNFSHCGAGNSIHDARAPLIISENGVTIGIISCCESQFGGAKRNGAGVAEVGPWIYSEISNLINLVDAIIVSIHGGLEDSPWPSPFIQDLYRSFIDAGARLVHGHHSHIPQGYEEYNNGLIMYGLGNFVVDPDNWKNYPNALWSLGVNISFKSNSINWDLFTCEIRIKPNSNEVIIEESTPEEFSSHRNYLKKCNLPFSNKSTIESLWQEVALRSFFSYGGKYMKMIRSDNPDLNELINLFLLKIKATLQNKNGHINPTLQELLLYYVMISCESHRQMLITSLGVLSGEIPDVRNKESQLLADEMMPWSRGIIPQ